MQRGQSQKEGKKNQGKGQKTEREEKSECRETKCDWDVTSGDGKQRVFTNDRVKTEERGGKNEFSGENKRESLLRLPWIVAETKL